MAEAAKVGGDVGIGRDERSMLTGATMDMNDEGAPTEIGDVLDSVRQIASAVKKGASPQLWTDDCMNQLILGVEHALAQGWGTVSDAFTDTARVLQTYENAGREDEAMAFLLECPKLIGALVDDAINSTSSAASEDAWRERYDLESQRIEEKGMSLVSDEDTSELGEGPEPLEFPDLSDASLKQLRSGGDELPTLDELPPLESVVGEPPASSSVSSRSEPAAPSQSEPARDDALDLTDVFEDVAAAAESEPEPEEEDVEAPLQQAPMDDAEDMPSPSQTVVEIVDRICEELAGLSQHEPEDRALAIEMIQGGVAALRREALRAEQGLSAELCDSMMRVTDGIAQSDSSSDERFTDIGFGFCGVYVEASGNAASDNITEWQTECQALIDALGGVPARVEDDADATEDTAAEAEPEEAVEATLEAAEDAAPPAEPDALEIAAESIAEPEPAPEPPRAAAAPPAERSPSAAEVKIVEDAKRSSQELFAAAQEALLKGDGEGAKVLALQAAALIAEAEVEKAEQRLRDAEARLKANMNSTEEARSEVKHCEKLVMNAASDVAAGESTLGKAKSHTAKNEGDLEESQAVVADLDKQIAELQRQREEQVQEVESVQKRLEEAREQEQAAERQLQTLMESEGVLRRDLEAARQQVKDFQRTTAEIESEMEAAREALGRQRSSLTDINQTMNRPEPIQTDGEDEEGSMLF